MQTPYLRPLGHRGPTVGDAQADHQRRLPILEEGGVVQQDHVLESGMGRSSVERSGPSPRVSEATCRVCRPSPYHTDVIRPPGGQPADVPGCIAVSASDDVVRNARQLGRVGLAMIAVSVVVALASGSGRVAILAVIGFVTFVGCQYLVGRYATD